jgi:ribosomal protein L30/L7E
MAIHAFTLENLESLDLGKASVAFNAHVKRVAMDCLDRPGDANPRKVSMEVVVKPVTNDDGSCERVKLQIQVTSKIPSHRTRVYDLGLRRNGQFVFSEDSPENFDQTTMFDEDK